MPTTVDSGPELPIVGRECSDVGVRHVVVKYVPRHMPPTAPDHVEAEHIHCPRCPASRFQRCSAGPTACRDRLRIALAGFEAGRLAASKGATRPPWADRPDVWFSGYDSARL